MKYVIDIPELMVEPIKNGWCPCPIDEFLRNGIFVKDTTIEELIESLGIDYKPHIDNVKFNGPATIVFWKDGTKTVVKFDKKGTRSKKLAVLYAFIRKIYGEGKNYHYILEEIENACK